MHIAHLELRDMNVYLCQDRPDVEPCIFPETTNTISNQELTGFLYLFLNGPRYLFGVVPKLSPTNPLKPALEMHCSLYIITSYKLFTKYHMYY